jgi:hypothetical protein
MGGGDGCSVATVVGSGFAGVVLAASLPAVVAIAGRPEALAAAFALTVSTDVTGLTGISALDVS